MRKYTVHLCIIALVALITSCSQDATDALTANARTTLSPTVYLFTG